MALYVPVSRRRRQSIGLASLALFVGLSAGALLGRSSAPQIGDRVRSVQSQARQTAAALRVLALHDQSGAISNRSGAGGADLALRRIRRELTDEFARAPWIGAPRRAALLDEQARVVALPDHTSPAFGAACEALADRIDDAFGTRRELAGAADRGGAQRWSKRSGARYDVPT